MIMWFVDMYEYTDDAWHQRYRIDHDQTPTYTNACKMAKIWLEKAEVGTTVTIYKVAGTPMHHHVDGTKTTVYQKQCERIAMWFW